MLLSLPVLVMSISVGTRRELLAVPPAALGSWTSLVVASSPSRRLRCVEFERDSPCPTEHARSDRVGVYNACGDRAVAVVEEIQAQFAAT